MRHDAISSSFEPLSRVICLIHDHRWTWYWANTASVSIVIVKVPPWQNPNNQSISTVCRHATPDFFTATSVQVDPKGGFINHQIFPAVRVRRQAFLPSKDLSRRVTETVKYSTLVISLFVLHCSIPPVLSGLSFCQSSSFHFLHISQSWDFHLTYCEFFLMMFSFHSFRCPIHEVLSPINRLSRWCT